MIKVIFPVSLWATGIGQGGIVGLKNGGDETGNSVKNSVNLASYILGADSPKRVVGDGGIKVENSYSLLSTRIGKNVVEAVTIISEDVIGQDGADISLQRGSNCFFLCRDIKMGYGKHVDYSIGW
ncbi:hypothetical protein NXV73_13545 [Bacteroides salyersiae]|nr:hypothetical protein [Bacteroides salyersiae]